MKALRLAAALVSARSPVGLHASSPSESWPWSAACCSTVTTCADPPRGDPDEGNKMSRSAVPRRRIPGYRGHRHPRQGDAAGLVDPPRHLKILGHGTTTGGILDCQDHLVERVWRSQPAAADGRRDLGRRPRDADGELSVRDRIRKGTIPGPRMWMSGPWIPRDLGDYSPRSSPGPRGYAEEAAGPPRNCEGGRRCHKATSSWVPRTKRRSRTPPPSQLKVQAHVSIEERARRIRSRCRRVDARRVGRMPPYDPELVRASRSGARPWSSRRAPGLLFPATVDFPERLQDTRLRRTSGP